MQEGTMVDRTKAGKSTRAAAAGRSKTTSSGTRAKTSGSRTRKPRLQLDTFRTRLLEERGRLREQLEQMIARTARRGRLDSAIQERNFDEDLGDSAAQTLERGLDLAMEQNLQDILEQIDASLEKIESGTYGECNLCSGPITERRLKALPFATLCIECQGRLEQ
jgi:DnaK suppressor protein